MGNEMWETMSECERHGIAGRCGIACPAHVKMGCPSMEDIFPKTLETAKALWESFGDVPLQEDEDGVSDNTDIQFLWFSPGTDRFEIWHWFEEYFSISIAVDLFGYPKN